MVHEDTSHLSLYCPISNTVPHTFTTPTHLTLQSHTTPPTTLLHPSHTPIAANTFLSTMHFSGLKALAPSMNTTLATNTRANSSLSHEPKTRSPSPPPPPLPSQQASSHLRQLSLHLLLHHREQDLVSPILYIAPFNGCSCSMQDTTTTAFLLRLPRLRLGEFSHFAP